MTEKKLKILAAADIEGDSEIFKALAKKAEKENVDLVCDAVTEFNSKKESQSHIHTAILNIEKSN
jgi:Icc-related predicted phosphoesterase